MNDPFDTPEFELFRAHVLEDFEKKFARLYEPIFRELADNAAESLKHYQSLGLI